MENSNSPFLMYATAYGGIFGIDPRQPKPAFSCYNELRDGIQTAFAASQGSSPLRTSFICLTPSPETFLMLKETTHGPLVGHHQGS